MREGQGGRGGQRPRSILYGGIAVAFLLGANAKAQIIPPLDAVRVASSLSQPVFVTASPVDYTRLFIVRQRGRVEILNLQTGSVNGTPFLDIGSVLTSNAHGEQGLLGMAFDPNYASNGKFYLYFTVPSAVGDTFQQGVTHVTQFQVASGDPDHADATSIASIGTIDEKLLLSFQHPEDNHNGGWIGFSPRSGDGNNLYIATGDGGSGNDQDGGFGHIEPGGNAQNLTTLLGKMLRIHVDSAAGTASTPPNNPFAGSGSGITQKIWAYGLRNPFRDSFDRLNGRMFIGDVGQSNREEVDAQEATNPSGGENYEWRLREGTIQTPTISGNPAVGGARPTGGIDPIKDYDRSVGGTVIGGYAYRGKQIPGLQGTYVFGDYVSHKIFTMNYDGTAASNFQEITSQLFPTATGSFSLGAPSSFGEDANGELYICDINNGAVFQIIPVTPNVKIDNVLKSGNSFVVHGIGVPFTNVTLQSSDTLVQPFAFLATLPVGGDGSFQFTDNNPPAARFYRVLYP
jgi:glucose/arabinose dehydrogenase